MRLTKTQILKIKQTVNLDNGLSIVRINVSEDKYMSKNESNYNIYCVDKDYNIVWQVKEIKTKVPFGDDPFCYLSKDVNGEIIADRFTGFTYKIDPETGEAEQTGFHK